MTDLEAWLAPRLAEVPQALSARILAAVHGGAGSGERYTERQVSGERYAGADDAGSDSVDVGASSESGRVLSTPAHRAPRTSETHRAPGTGEAPRSSLPQALLQIAESLLSAAQSAPPTRDTAMTLLAADALITYACEAQAEADPKGIAELG